MADCSKRFTADTLTQEILRKHFAIDGPMAASLLTGRTALRALADVARMHSLLLLCYTGAAS
jgi:hypothetical protein